MSVTPNLPRNWRGLAAMMHGDALGVIDAALEPDRIQDCFLAECGLTAGAPRPLPTSLDSETVESHRAASPPPHLPMPDDFAKLLNPERALIFRVIHRANLAWVLQHGLHCGTSATRSDHWVSIGNQELISKRACWPVSLAPGGVLNDYVPFYFTPFSVMMHNITTGWNGVTRHPKQDILILVASLRRVAELRMVFLFTTSHANNALVTYSNDLAGLNLIDWDILQTRNFRRDPDDPAKFARYQAEALIHRHCPLSGLSGIVCFNGPVKLQVQQALTAADVTLPVAARPGWYF